MAEVLVLAEHSGGEVKKVTGELLTLARQFGEPAAVWIGGGRPSGRGAAGRVRRDQGVRGRRRRLSDYVTGPEAECSPPWSASSPRPRC